MTEKNQKKSKEKILKKEYEILKNNESKKIILTDKELENYKAYLNYKTENEQALNEFKNEREKFFCEVLHTKSN